MSLFLSKLFSLLLFRISVVCCSLQTDESAYLQTILSTGPLSVGTAAENSDSSLQNYLKDLYFALNQHIKTGVPSRTDQKFESVQICINEGNITGEPTLLKFKLQPTPADISLITSAILRIFLTPTHKFVFDSIQAFQVVKGQPLDAPDAHRLLSTQFITSQPEQTGQWIEFNVLPAVSDWLRGAKPNLGLLISGLQTFNVVQFYYHPLLVIKFDSYKKDDTGLARFEIFGPQNSSFVQTDELISQPRLTCQKKELWVNFNKWGLLEPLNQDIGFCSGPCGKSDLGLDAAEHTGLMALLSENNSNVIGPLCTPSEYKPAAIMYKQLNGNYIIKKINQLVVKKCSCR